MNKKILILLLTMVMGITCMLPADTYASEIDAQSEIQETLENFFEALLGTLSEHSAKDYDSNDFQGIDGYIIAKSFVNTRETYKKLNGGIHEVELEDLVLDNVFEGDDCLEVSAYVKYRYVYGNNESCQVGCLYRVKMAGAEDGYKILDLDNSDIETQKIKEDLHIQEQGIGTVSNDDIFESVNRYFEDMQRGVDDLQQMEDFAVPEDTGAEPASVNISFGGSSLGI